MLRTLQVNHGHTNYARYSVLCCSFGTAVSCTTKLVDFSSCLSRLSENHSAHRRQMMARARRISVPPRRGSSSSQLGFSLLLVLMLFGHRDFAFSD